MFRDMTKDQDLWKSVIHGSRSISAGVKTRASMEEMDVRTMTVIVMMRLFYRHPVHSSCRFLATVIASEELYLRFIVAYNNITVIA